MSPVRFPFWIHSNSYSISTGMSMRDSCTSSCIPANAVFLHSRPYPSMVLTSQYLFSPQHLNSSKSSDTGASTPYLFKPSESSSSSNLPSDSSMLGPDTIQSPRMLRSSSEEQSTTMESVSHIIT